MNLNCPVPINKFKNNKNGRKYINLYNNLTIAKRGVEFRHSTRYASRIRQETGNRVTAEYRKQSKAAYKSQ